MGDFTGQLQCWLTFWQSFLGRAPTCTWLAEGPQWLFPSLLIGWEGCLLGCPGPPLHKRQPLWPVSVGERNGWPPSWLFLFVLAASLLPGGLWGWAAATSGFHQGASVFIFSFISLLLFLFLVSFFYLPLPHKWFQAKWQKPPFFMLFLENIVFCGFCNNCKIYLSRSLLMVSEIT